MHMDAGGDPMGSYGEEDWVRKELGNDEEAWAWAMGHLVEHAVIALATRSDEGPRVRPVTAVLHEGSVYILTSTDDAKVRHLEVDPRFEFYVLVKEEDSTGYVRCSGKASKVADPDLRRRVGDAAGFVDNF
ncbi:MAG: hypothetical protein GQ558_00960, partial [Thermoplasmata archaeon]|nr:hypothetical protein [Thermoplasmata archaeon]